MINSRKVLAIIPARGGSKGVPGKNIKTIAGKPLIAWTINEAKKSKYIDRLILSSEDLNIIEVAKELGCDVPFLRPRALAEDHTPGVEPVLHAIGELPEYDIVMLLQPTSPLRVAEDIDGCIEELIKMNARSCVSVTETEHSPYWMYTIDKNKQMEPVISQEIHFHNRQELPVSYVLNGALYCSEVSWLLESKSFFSKDSIAYIMPRGRSYDIDTEEDFAFCDMLLKRIK